ncbi:MAG: NUDIX hydrolase [Janthinobacterium lividum]
MRRTNEQVPSAATSDRQILTVDVVVLTVFDRTLRVGLVTRVADPFPGYDALIGGYVHANEDADVGATAMRVLREKTGLGGLFVEQLRTFSGPARDPRGWSATVAHMALVPWHRLEPLVGASPLRFVPIADAYGALAFDHDAILMAAVGRVRGKGAYSTLPARFLPDAFTLAQLRETYEVVLDQGPIDASSFRRKVSELDLIEPAGESASTGGRPASLYRLRPGDGIFDRRI